MQITSGKIEGAQKVLVYGPEGIGKSTFAAAFPNPLFIDVEGSTRHLDVRRLPTPQSWMMLLEEVAFVRLNPDVCSTLVIDTADWAEKLCMQQVCAKGDSKGPKEGIEDFGYGKGYTYLAEEYGKLLNLLTEVVDRGVNVVMTAHASLTKFEQPDEMAAYDRWGLKLTNTKKGLGTASLTKEWADMVLFANYKTFAVKSEDGTCKPQGGKRVMFTSHHPAWDAKNRHELAGELEFDFAAIAHAIPDKGVEVVYGKPEAAGAQVAVTPQEEREHAERAENRVHGGTDKTDAELAAEAPATRDSAPTVNAPLHVVKLMQLMDASGVEEAEVRAAVHAKGYFPLATPIEKYPAEFVEGALIGAWPKVLAAINSSKQTSIYAPTPFDN